MAPFAAWGTGRMCALLSGRLGLVLEVPSSAHPFSPLATLLPSVPPARLLLRWGQVPQGGQRAQEQMGAGAEPLEGGQGGKHQHHGGGKLRTA